MRIDPAGKEFKTDSDAIFMAEVYAVQVSIDTPMVDPERYVAVLNAKRVEIAKVAVYSKPTALA